MTSAEDAPNKKVPYRSPVYLALYVFVFLVVTISLILILNNSGDTTEATTKPKNETSNPAPTATSPEDSLTIYYGYFIDLHNESVTPVQKERYTVRSVSDLYACSYNESKGVKEQTDEQIAQVLNIDMVGDPNNLSSMGTLKFWDGQMYMASEFANSKYITISYTSTTKGKPGQGVIMLAPYQDSYPGEKTIFCGNWWGSFKNVGLPKIYKGPYILSDKELHDSIPADKEILDYLERSVESPVDLENELFTTH